jgi:hypothetical protein
MTKNINEYKSTITVKFDINNHEAQSKITLYRYS